MSDFVLNYGSEEVGGGSTAFSPGINDNVSLSTFQFVREDNGTEYLQLAFSKEGSEIRDRVYAPRKFPPKKKKDGSMENEMEAKARIWGDINSKIKHIATNFVSEDTFDSRIRDARVSSFEQFCKSCTAMLPPNFSSNKGQLIVGYNNRGYLGVPYAMWVTGAFFSVNNIKGELKVTKNVKLERDVENNDSEIISEDSIPVSWLSNENPESQINF